jgi:hypothetical protein
MSSRKSEFVWSRRGPCLDEVETIVRDVYAFVLAALSLLSLILLCMAVACIEGSRLSSPSAYIFQRTIVAAILVTGICAEPLVAYGFSIIAKHVMNSWLIRSERKDDESQEDFRKRSTSFGYIFIMLAEEMVRPKYRWIGTPKSEKFMLGRMVLKLALKILFLAFAVAEILLFLNTVEMVPHHEQMHTPWENHTTAFGGKAGSSYQVIGRQLIANRTFCMDHWMRFNKSDRSGACENTIFHQINKTTTQTELNGTVRTPTLPLIGAYCKRNCEESKVNRQSIGKLVVAENVVAETNFSASYSTFGDSNSASKAPLGKAEVYLYNTTDVSTKDENLLDGTHKLRFPVENSSSGYEWVVTVITRVTRATVTYDAVPNGINISKVEYYGAENLTIPERLRPEKLQDDLGDTIQNMISTPFGYFLRENPANATTSTRSAQQEVFVTMLAAIHVRSAYNNATGDHRDDKETSKAYAIAWQVKQKNLPVLVLAIVVNLIALLVYSIARLHNSGSGNLIMDDFVQLSSVFRLVVDDMAQPCAGSDRFRDNAETSLMTTYGLGIQADAAGHAVVRRVGEVDMIHLTASSGDVTPWNENCLPDIMERQHKVRVGHEKKRL